MAIIKGNTHLKVAIAVAKDVHDAHMSREIRAAFNLEAYPLAGRTVAKKVLEYAISFSSGHMPELVFEDGDLDKGLLMERLRQDGYPTPIFKPKKDTLDRKTGLIIRGYTPLQAADLWAYELFLGFKNDRKDVPFESFRWPFRALDKIPGEPGIFWEKDMQRTNSMLAQQRSGSTFIRDPSSGAVLLPHFNQREKE